MKIQTLFGALALSVGLSSCATEVVKEANYDIIPLPKEVVKQTGDAFTLDKSVKIVYPAGNDKMQKNADFLASYINEMVGYKPEITTDVNAKNAIQLNLGLEAESEGYHMNVNKESVQIFGTTEAGVFYGIQTLRKSLPFEMNATVKLAPVQIKDFPRFQYRGMMLDVSRHFFPIEFIKKYIDILALHNINRFHWHLSEDQGWRIEIKKYPLLTEIGSKRSETVIGRNSGEYDGIPYGGFYTQEEAKELVAYAAERYITVIPEIDMPGHMLAALTAYPELGCTGGPYEVWRQWGVSDEVLCIGNDKTLEFITDVLAEIIEIFPSEYIHVGGDECPKVRWTTCPKCQARIKALGLKADKHHSAEDRLQSFAISHAEKFLNANGRQIIGWDEILEGGLAPNATVMSWRGMGGGIEAAKQGHDVIMTPTTNVYFDYYQTKDLKDEPLAIGGYVPVKSVYDFEPVPASLTKEQQKYVIGTQANLWTEYVPTSDHVEYMVMPRMAALCEVQWTNPEQKDYASFQKRLPRMLDVYRAAGYNYAKHVLNVEAKFVPNTEEGVLDVFLTTIDDASIHYTTDGSEPTSASPLYKDVVKVKENCTLKAIVVRASGNSKVLEEQIEFSKSSMKPITMLQPINPQYFFEGATTLVDGLKGNGNYKTGRWIAFYKNDLEAIIDFKEETEISSVTIDTCVEKGDWVFDARSITVFVSNDGVNFTQVAKEEYPVMSESDYNGIHNHKLTFDSVKTKFVKVHAQPEHKMPKWHNGAGSPSFMFVDEITVD